MASRFGQRLRAQLLREAAAVIVGSEATARAARRCSTSGATGCGSSRSRRGPAFARRAHDRAASPPEPASRERLGLPDRYLVYSGRFDARHDLATCSRARRAGRRGRPTGRRRRADRAGRRGCSWSARARTIGRRSPGRRRGAASARPSPTRRRSPAPDLAGLVRGARAVILPVVSEAAGLPAIEALACGTPVVASAVGPLPELVGAAGLLVEPRDPDRLAVALATIWADDAVHARIADGGRDAGGDGPRGPGPTWRARRGRSTPRSGSGARRSRPRSGRVGRPAPRLSRGVADGTGVAGGWSEPALNETG